MRAPGLLPVTLPVAFAKEGEGVGASGPTQTDVHVDGVKWKVKRKRIQQRHVPDPMTDRPNSGVGPIPLGATSISKKFKVVALDQDTPDPNSIGSHLGTGYGLWIKPKKKNNRDQFGNKILATSDAMQVKDILPLWDPRYPIKDPKDLVVSDKILDTLKKGEVIHSVVIGYSKKHDRVMLVDGHHHVAGALQIGRDSLPAIVIKVKPLKRGARPEDEDIPVKKEMIHQWLEGIDPFVEVRKLYNQDQPRDDHGRWTSDGGEGGGSSSKLSAPVLPISASEARGNSRPVTQSEFDSLVSKGQTLLASYKSSPPTGLTSNLDSLTDTAFKACQSEWGGVTIDSHTGKTVNPDHGYALTVKDPGQDSVSIPINADRSLFAAAMKEATSRFSRQLSLSQHNLGVFRDDDTNRIDMDPVLVVNSTAEVEAIGAATHAVGGAYDFSTGNGYFPPHVASSAPSTLKKYLEEMTKEVQTRRSIAQHFAETRDPNRPMFDPNAEKDPILPGPVSAPKTPFVSSAMVKAATDLFSIVPLLPVVPIIKAGPPDEARDPAGRWYHGSRYTLKPGDLLTPGHKSSWGAGQSDGFVYFTNNVRAAHEFADAGTGPDDDPDSAPKVYEVEPTGGYETDGLETRIVSRRTRQPVRIVRRLTHADLRRNAVTVTKSWEDEPRGQPNNAGEWASSPGAGAGLSNAKPLPPPTPPPMHAPIDNINSIGGRVSAPQAKDVVSVRERDKNGPDAPVMLTSALIGRGKKNQIGQTVARLSVVPGFEQLKSIKDPEVAIKTGVDIMARNEVDLFDESMSISREGTIAHSIWYPRAHDIGVQWGKELQFHPDAIYGAMAALSPGADWANNLAWARYFGEQIHNEDKITTDPKVVDMINQTRLASYNEAIKGGTDATKPEPSDIKAGVLLKDLSDAQAAKYIRAMADMNGGIKQLGGQVGFGDPSKKAIPNKYEAMAKAVSILRDPRHANIDTQLGNEMKVRSFYNNIRDPMDTKYEDVTTDTHHYGVALGLPLGMSHPFIASGTDSVTAGPKTANTGVSGIYPMVAEATRKATDIVNAKYADQGIHLLPNQLQSVVWEMHRQLYPSTLRRDAGGDDGSTRKGKALSDYKGTFIDFVGHVRADVNAGRMSHEDGLAKILLERERIRQDQIARSATKKKEGKSKIPSLEQLKATWDKDGADLGITPLGKG